MLRNLIIALVLLTAGAASAQTYPSPRLQALGVGTAAPAAGYANVTGGYEINGARLSASDVPYLQGSTGSVAYSIASKFQNKISVCDFGACGVSTDVSTAFQDAVDALPTSGGEIEVPDGSYIIDTAPTWGNKSIFWNFGPNAVVTGTQTTFPRMATNTAQVPVGPWIQSQSTVASPTGGGIAAFNAEMLQPSTYVGQSVGIYAGASGSSSNANSNVWAINNLIQANTGAAGHYQGDEVDVNDFSSSATVWGINISGVGSVSPQNGITINRASGPDWAVGERIANASTGLQVGTGIVFPNSLLSGNITANGNDGIVLQRFTDTSPTGSFIRGTNASNTANVFEIDTSGNASFLGAIYPSQTNGIVGTTTNNNANAGSIGEYISSTATVPVTSATAANVTSISLTAGDWTVYGNVLFTSTGAAITAELCSFSSTSATLAVAPFYAQNAENIGAGGSGTCTPPVQRFSLASTTTVYLVVNQVYTSGSVSAQGYIAARRTR